MKLGKVTRGVNNVASPSNEDVSGEDASDEDTSGEDTLCLAYSALAGVFNQEYLPLPRSCTKPSTSSVWPSTTIKLG